MKKTGTKWFNLRGFVMLTAAVSGLGLPITGLANHLHQMESMLSVSRHAWMSAHNVPGVLFIVSSVSHALLNRRTFLNHVRGRAVRPGISKEAIGAVILVAVMLSIAVGHAIHQELLD
ncbi:MAG TPA: DUF4405 domain-containing protein [Syntrophobacter fumaroxidans]|mgnify:CR=1 FL=1|nr:DUF4405 domain-containing protein [Syntrophobacter fumaroxidans]